MNRLTDGQLETIRLRCRERNDPWTARTEKDWYLRSRLSNIETKINVLLTRRLWERGKSETLKLLGTKQ